jgi:hypothetical protein
MCILRGWQSLAICAVLRRSPTGRDSPRLVACRQFGCRQTQILLSHNSQHISAFHHQAATDTRGRIGADARAHSSPPLHNHGGYESISIAALKSLRMLFDSNFGVIKPLDEIRRSFGFCADRVKLQRASLSRFNQTAAGGGSLTRLRQQGGR